MIQEEYCSFEQAKALKELGFPQNTNKFYDACMSKSNFTSPSDVIYYAKPTLSLAQKWLREEKNLHVDILYYDVTKLYNCYIVEISTFVAKTDYTSYEQALSAGIDKCIELLRTK